MLRQTIRTTFNVGQCTLCRRPIFKLYASNLHNASRPSIADHFKRNGKPPIPMVTIDDEVGSALPLMGYHRKLFLLQIISRRLNCTPKTAKTILLSSVRIRRQSSVNIGRLMNVLMVDNNIRSEVILNNTWLLAEQYGQ